VVLASCALLAAPAVGQISPGSLGLREASKPDFMSRDLALFIDALGLNEQQAGVIAVLLDEYQETFTARLGETRAELTKLTPKRDPAGIANADRSALAETVRRIQEEMRQRLREVDDPDQRQKLIEEYQARIAELREQYREQNPAPEVDDDLLRKRSAVIARWLRDKAALREQLIEDVAAVIEDEQRDRWPALERHLRRERTLDESRLSGEQVDLVKLIDEMRLDEETLRGAAPILGAYGETLDAALIARNEFVQTSRVRILEAMQSGDTSELLRLIDRELALRETVRDVNETYAQRLAEALPAEHGAALLASYYELGYSHIARATTADRLFDAALEAREIDDATRDALREMHEAYVEERAAWDRRLREIVRTNESAQIRRQYERIAARGVDRPDQRSPDPMRQAMQEREQFMDAYVVRIRDLLPDEVFRRLPGASRWRVRDGSDDD
jgi:Spy/CpxP family protein refolding chaperone